MEVLARRDGEEGVAVGSRKNSRSCFFRPSPEKRPVASRVSFARFSPVRMEGRALIHREPWRERRNGRYPACFPPPQYRSRESVHIRSKQSTAAYCTLFISRSRERNQGSPETCFRTGPNRRLRGGDRRMQFSAAIEDFHPLAQSTFPPRSVVPSACDTTISLVSILPSFPPRRTPNPHSDSHSHVLSAYTQHTSPPAVHNLASADDHRISPTSVQGSDGTLTDGGCTTAGRMRVLTGAPCPALHCTARQCEHCARREQQIWRLSARSGKRKKKIYYHMGGEEGGGGV